MNEQAHRYVRQAVRPAHGRQLCGLEVSRTCRAGKLELRLRVRNEPRRYRREIEIGRDQELRLRDTVQAGRKGAQAARASFRMSGAMLFLLIAGPKFAGQPPWHETMGF